MSEWPSVGTVVVWSFNNHHAVVVLDVECTEVRGFGDDIDKGVFITLLSPDGTSGVYWFDEPDDFTFEYDIVG